MKKPAGSSCSLRVLYDGLFLHQNFHGLTQGFLSPHVSRENHIGNAGEAAACIGLPDGNARADLAQHIGLLDAQGLGAHWT